MGRHLGTRAEEGVSSETLRTSVHDMARSCKGVQPCSAAQPCGAWHSLSGKRALTAWPTRGSSLSQPFLSIRPMICSALTMAKLCFTVMVGERSEKKKPPILRGLTCGAGGGWWGGTGSGGACGGAITVHMAQGGFCLNADTSMHAAQAGQGAGPTSR